MVHLDFVNQEVPEPAQWERPDLTELVNLAIRSPRKFGSLPDRMLQSLQRLEQTLDPNIAEDAVNFLRRIVDFQGTHHWYADRMLGVGGFGRVGLWIRKDVTGDVIDRLAIKEFTNDESFKPLYYVERDGRAIQELLAESVVQSQLNYSDCENIVHLRGYAFVCDRSRTREEFEATPHAGSLREALRYGRYRQYLEYAPYGTLATLMERYRAWSQWLPEQFLWHVFDSLASVLQRMKGQPRSERIASKRRDWRPYSKVLHTDIKPENILLGYETLRNETLAANGGNKMMPFPTIKLADFGSSVITHRDDIRNPLTLWHQGSVGYRPPEQCHYGVHFEAPPNSRGRNRGHPTMDNSHGACALDERSNPGPGSKFRSASDVWQVGKVMYDLTTLSKAISFENNWERREADYIRNEHRLIRDYQTLPFQISTNDPGATNPYSHDLMDLIEQCLTPAIRTRIVPDDLKRETLKHIRDVDNNVERGLPGADTDARSGKKLKIYCRGNEINDMDLGDAPFRPDQDEYEAIMSDAFVDPDEPPLQLPPRKWNIDEIDRELDGQESDSENLWVVQNGRIWFLNPLSGPNLIQQPGGEEEGVGVKEEEEEKVEVKEEENLW